MLTIILPFYFVDIIRPTRLEGDGNVEVERKKSLSNGEYGTGSSTIVVTRWSVRVRVLWGSAIAHGHPAQNTPVFVACVYYITSNKNIHFEMILDVGIGEKRKETRFLI